MPAARPGPLFDAALASVLEQRHEDLEVVVSDDSGGALAGAVRRAGDPRVRHLANPRPLGFAGNHVAALSAARGRHLAVLHDDDRYLPDFLARTLAALAADPDVGIACTDCWLDRGGPRLNRRPVAVAAGRHEAWLPLVVAHNVFLPSTTVLRREVWEGTMRSWPDLIVADLTLFIEAARTGWPLAWIDEPLVVYRMHGGQIGTDDLRHRDGLVRLWDAYAFDEDPEAEALRRQRLAHWLVARAGVWLRRGEPARARDDLARAAAVDPGTQRSRRRLLALLVRQPQLLTLAHGIRERRRGG
jgi:glycosyltransferase involved in cell wall biosynthesis